MLLANLNSINLALKQRNKSTEVLRNTMQQYFNILNSKSITDTKKFWETVKPLFSNKIILHENNRVIKDQKISHTLNKYFTNLAKTFKFNKISPALKKKSLNPLKTILSKKIWNILIAKKYLLFVNFKNSNNNKQLRSYQKTKPVHWKIFQWRSWSTRFIFTARYPQTFSTIV